MNFEVGISYLVKSSTVRYRIYSTTSGCKKQRERAIMIEGCECKALIKYAMKNTASVHLSNEVCGLIREVYQDL